MDQGKLLDRGQIQLNVRLTPDKVVVDVYSAGGLKPQQSSQANSNVEIRLIAGDRSSSNNINNNNNEDKENDEETQRLEKKSTKIVCSTNNPIYNKTLSCDLTPEVAADINCRLLITVWHSDVENRSQREMLGCVSFGLKHLRAKANCSEVVHGSYYLLPSSVGQRKHLRVEQAAQSAAEAAAAAAAAAVIAASPSQRSMSNYTWSISRRSERSCSVSSSRHYAAPPSITSPTPPPPTLPPAAIPLPCFDVDVKSNQVKSIQVIVNKEPAGFGFTIKHSCPVTVGRVKSTGGARSAGLKRGDIIDCINGRNVSRSSAQSVARIIRVTEQTLVMNVIRLPRSATLSKDCCHAAAADFMTNAYDNENRVPRAANLSASETNISQTPAETIKRDSILVPERISSNSVNSSHCKTSRYSRRAADKTEEKRRKIDPSINSLFRRHLSEFRSDASTEPFTNRCVLESRFTATYGSTKGSLPEVKEESVYEEIGEFCSRGDTNSLYERLQLNAGTSSHCAVKLEHDFVVESHSIPNGATIKTRAASPVESDCAISQQAPITRERLTSLNPKSEIGENNASNAVNSFSKTVLRQTASVDTSADDVIDETVSSHDRAFLICRKSPASCTKSPSRTRWDPFISVILNPDESMTGALRKGNCDVTWPPKDLRNVADTSIVSCSPDRADRSSDYFSYSSDSVHGACQTIDRSFDARCWAYLSSGDSGDQVANKVIGRSNDTALRLLTEEETMTREYAMRAIECVKQHERAYISDLLDGAQRYSRPLLHRILTRQQHSGLFQNVEKLLALSQFLVSGLSDLAETRSDNRMMTSSNRARSIGALYTAKLSMFVDCYGHYVHGLSAARQLLADLIKLPQFTAFLKQTLSDGDGLTIASFLHRPVQHVADICSDLSRLISHLPVTSLAERQRLETVIAALQQLLQLADTSSGAPVRTEVRPMTSQPSSFSSSSTGGEGDHSSLHGLGGSRSTSASSGAYSGITECSAYRTNFTLSKTSTSPAVLNISKEHENRASTPPPQRRKVFALLRGGMGQPNIREFVTK